MKMEIPESHIYHILLFYIQKGKNSAQAHCKWCGVYGNECLTECQYQNWFARFCIRTLDIESSSGQLIVEKVDEI